MIRRDYLLRMIDQCVRALMRSRELADLRQYDLAQGEVDQAFQSLLGMSATDALKLPEPELTALLLQGEPPLVLPQKSLLCVTLFYRAGELAAGRGDLPGSQAFHLKALNFRLLSLWRDADPLVPDYVPNLEVLIGALDSTTLPPEISIRLMQAYEQSGQFAKAEDVLFDLVANLPHEGSIAEFGRQFYRRLLRQSDDALTLGNLPRNEVELGLRDLESRQTT